MTTHPAGPYNLRVSAAEAPGAEIARRDQAAWRRWGPYLSERAWGTVREDYSEDGDAWRFFPHDHARSRAYRWNEDGLGGICDDRQLLCLAFAFWNGRDPILKERIFGLTGHEGNHGEDAKEYWWYLDSTPTHSWMRWRYVYPQADFPYERARRPRTRAAIAAPPSTSCSTPASSTRTATGTITVDYAKAAPDDFCLRVRSRNAGPDAAMLHVLPDAVVPQPLVVGPGGRSAVIREDGGRSSPSMRRWAA